MYFGGGPMATILQYATDNTGSTMYTITFLRYENLILSGHQVTYMYMCTCTNAAGLTSVPVPWSALYRAHSSDPS